MTSKFLKGNPVIDGNRVANGYEQITSLSTAAGFTPPAGSLYAVIQAENDDIRWRDDGTNPTSSVGMLLTEGSILHYTAHLLGSLKAIEINGSGILNVSYYK